LLGVVLSVRGRALLAPFHAAMVMCAVTAALAAVCAFIWVKGNNRQQM
jgi:hypothetical protein